VQDGIKINTTSSAQRSGRVGAGCLAWANAASAVTYGSVGWHAVEVSIGGQEDLPHPPM